MRNAFIATIAALTLILAFIGCERVQNVVVTPETADTVKIGFLASGSRTTYPNGGHIAVAEINAKGGLLGRTVELVTEVGIPTPDAAAEAASQMILTEEIIALIGPNRSTQAIRIATLAQEHSLPIVTTTATNPMLQAQATLFSWPPSQTHIKVPSWRDLPLRNSV